MGIETHLHKRVLIADDLPNMRADLLKILRELGFTNIKEAPDGRAAWDELRTESNYGKPYEIIFSDINMPLMNGLQLLKQIRSMEAYKKVPVFMVSTENEKEIIVKAIIEGATDYIIKPYQSNVVKEKILGRLK